MSDDYLFDPQSEESNPEIEALESKLRPLRYQDRTFDVPAISKVAPIRRLPRIGALLLVAAMLLLYFRTRSDDGRVPRVSSESGSAAPAFQVLRESGAPTIGGTVFAEQGSLGEGAWLETDSNSRASIQVATIGNVKVAPDSRVQLVHSGLNEHRLSLTRGRIDAVVNAPPRLFVVDTPSAAAVDLGCAYHLVVQGDGSTLLHVDSGQVSLEGKGKRSWVPAGADCLTKTDQGPGTPSWTDSDARFRAVLEAYDWQHGTLDAVLRQADTPDTLSLWHILQRVPVKERKKVAERLEKLAPTVKVKESVTAVLDEPGLLELREELSQIW